LSGGTTKTQKKPWPDNLCLDRDSKWETRECKSTFTILTNKHSQYESHKYYSLTGAQQCTVIMHKDKEKPVTEVISENYKLRDSKK